MENRSCAWIFCWELSLNKDPVNFLPVYWISIRQSPKKNLSSLLSHYKQSLQERRQSFLGIDSDTVPAIWFFFCDMVKWRCLEILLQSPGEKSLRYSSTYNHQQLWNFLDHSINKFIYNPTASENILPREWLFWWETTRGVLLRACHWIWYQENPQTFLFLFFIKSFEEIIEDSKDYFPNFLAPTWILYIFPGHSRQKGSPRKKTP